MSALVYGAYGYTGRLIARAAVERGLQPILAGRDARRLEELGRSLELPTRAASLSEPQRLREVVDDISVVLHCAGPFVHTAPPMVAACLDAGTHYLDLTGEIDVFQALADRDQAARDAGCMLLPGIGFDVVPSDCVGRFVAEQSTDATLLEVALFVDGTMSRGTVKTLIEQMGRGGVVRREGQLRDVPPGWTGRSVDFGDRRRRVISIPEGSVLTSRVSTDVPNMTAYVAVPLLLQKLLRVSRHVQGILSWSPLKQLLKRLVDRRRPGPTAAERWEGRTVVWASAWCPGGTRVTARLHGPDAYTFTARAASNALQRVLDGTASPGYQTPSTAFGTDFALAVDGMSRRIIEAPSGP